MAEPSFLVFDAVGTVIRPRHSISGLYCSVAKRHGVIVERETIKLRFQLARGKHFDNRPQQPSSELAEEECWRQVVADVFLECNDTRPIFEDLWSAYASADQWMLFDDVAETLRQLIKQGRGLAIASNFDSRLLPICKRLGSPLSDIDHVYCSSLLGFRKPDSRFFELVQQNLFRKGVLTASQPLTMIGDDPIKDICAARDAGWQASLLDRQVANFAMVLQSL